MEFENDHGPDYKYDIYSDTEQEEGEEEEEEEEEYCDDYGKENPQTSLRCVIYCHCKKCYVKSTYGAADAANIANAYYERNRTRRDCSGTETQTQNIKLNRQNRFVVMAHRGFRVSFPDPSGEILSQHTYEETEDEPKTHTKKMQQLVAQGAWCDERAMHYTNLIDDFKHYEKYCNTVDSSAFPRHHALVSAAFSSSVAILEGRLWDSFSSAIPIEHYIRAFAPKWDNIKMKSKPAAHAPPSSVFTETLFRQRCNLVAYSGIAGVLCARLFHTCRKTTSDPYFRKSAFKMMQRVHSAHTCEILVDNRYQVMTPKNDASFDSLSFKNARAELRILYAACIGELKTKAIRYARGFINICEIHSDHRFEKMRLLMIVCLKRLINDPNKFNDLSKPRISSSKRTIQIMKFVTEFPGLYDFNVARAYGAATMRLRIATISTQIRLAGDGCSAALLAFAVLEPRMVDDHIAPEIDPRYCGIAELDRELYIPSRDKTFGTVLQKYRHHIPRTADVIKDVCRHLL